MTKAEEKVRFANQILDEIDKYREELANNKKFSDAMYAGAPVAWIKMIINKVAFEQVKQSINNPEK